jgi:ATP-dependent DNA helicase RecQ
VYSHALALLREMLGPTAKFHPGQWEAVEALAVHAQRVLLIQRTGWGKSVVYFLASKLLRQKGAGPTVRVGNWGHRLEPKKIHSMKNGFSSFRFQGKNSFFHAF